MKSCLWMVIALLGISSLFYLGYQFKRMADSGTEVVRELRQTRHTVNELIMYPEKNRQLVRNVEDWLRRAR